MCSRAGKRREAQFTLQMLPAANLIVVAAAVCSVGFVKSHEPASGGQPAASELGSTANRVSVEDVENSLRVTNHHYQKLEQPTAAANLRSLVARKSRSFPRCGCRHQVAHPVEIARESQKG